MELKSGYQQTEVGVIPDDWAVKRLGDFAVVRDGTHQTPKYVPVGIPFYSVEHVTSGNFTDTKFISLEEHRFLTRSYKIERGDILMTRIGSIGDCKLVDWDVEASFYVSLALLKFRGVSASFFAQYSNSTGFKRQVELHSLASAVPKKINLGPISDVLVALPPTTTEQSAIATALSDMDALLAAQDALIQKKRAIKQGAMQELLAGKRRLPGFGGAWKVTTLGELAHIKTGSRNNEDKVEDGDYPFFVRSEFIERIDGYSYDCEAILVPGEGKIGEIFHYVNGRFDVHQRVYAITRFVSDVSGQFVHLYLMMHFGQWAMQNTVKATVDSLRLPTFQNFEMRLPPTKAEQEAIARTISDMEMEIVALEAKREKTVLLKQGMMQELLTGKTRLVTHAAQGLEASSNVIPFKTKNQKQQDGAAPTEKNAEGCKTNMPFMRSVLAAEIVDQLHNESTFGHVKFAKLIFLAEHLCKVHTGSNYHRDAAGPYDNRALRSIDSQMKKLKWFDAHKLGDRYLYLPMEKHGGHKEYFDRYYANIRTKLDEIIATFRTAKTQQCEIVATLYGAWADLINLGKSATDDAILDQVLNHWHDKKREIPEERWRKALEWMREKDYVPEGDQKA